MSLISHPPHVADLTHVRSQLIPNVSFREAELELVVYEEKCIARDTVLMEKRWANSCIKKTDRRKKLVLTSQITEEIGFRMLEDLFSSG